MVPKDNIARTPISTGSFAKSYVSATGGRKPPPNPSVRKNWKFQRRLECRQNKKIPGSGGADPGTGVRDAGPKTFLNFTAVSNSSGALPAKRETQVEWPSQALCRETRLLSGASPKPPRRREKAARERLPKLCGCQTSKPCSSVCSSPLPLIQYVNRVVMLDGQNHGLENIDVPAVRDSQTNHIFGLGHEAPAQRYPQVPCYDSEYHRLPHPDRVATYHLSPLMRLVRRTRASFGQACDLANGTAGYNQ